MRPSVLRIIEGLHDQPAYVRNRRIDILAAHPLARALLGEVEQDPAHTCRFVLLDPRATRMYPEGERVARDGVGVLRVEVAKNRYDRGLSNLIGEQGLSITVHSAEPGSPALWTGEGQ